MILFTLLLILLSKKPVPIDGSVTLLPFGSLELCDGDEQHFQCRPKNNSLSVWCISGLSGLEDINGVTAKSLSDNFGEKFHTNDTDSFTYPSTLTVHSITVKDTGAVIKCRSGILDYSHFSNAAVLSVGIPNCNIEIEVTKLRNSIFENMVIWNISSCNVQPTEYELTWAEIGSPIPISGTSGKITQNFYSLKLPFCKVYRVTVHLYNKCGVGNSADITLYQDRHPMALTSENVTGIFQLIMPKKVCPTTPIILHINTSHFSHHKYLCKGELMLHVSVTNQVGEERHSEILIFNGSAEEHASNIVMANFVPQLILGSSILILSIEELNISETYMLPEIHVLKVSWLLHGSNTVVVTCKTSCPGESLNSEFKCQSYFHNNKDHKAIAPFMKGIALLKLSIVSDQLQMNLKVLEVELLQNGTIIERKTIIIDYEVNMENTINKSTVRAIVLAASLLVIGGIIAIILFLSVCFVYNWCRRDRDSNWNSSVMQDYEVSQNFEGINNTVTYKNCIHKEKVIYDEPMNIIHMPDKENIDMTTNPAYDEL